MKAVKISQKPTKMEPNPNRERNMYQKLRNQKETALNDIAFLNACKRHHVKPSFIKVRCAVNNTRTLKAIEAAERVWMSEELQHHNAKLMSIERRSYELRGKLIGIMTSDEWRAFDARVTERSAELGWEKRRIQKRKLEILKARRNNSDQIQPRPRILPDFVVNLSDETFSTEEMECLNNGLNFAIPPEKLPLDEAIIDLQIIARAISRHQHLDAEETPVMINTFEGEAAAALAEIPMRRRPNPMNNVLKGLREKPVEILKADKGDKVVILGKDQYERLVMDHINNGPYQSIRNPLPSTLADYKTTIRNLRTIEYQTMAKRWKVSNPIVPKLYGLPKIHKQGPLKIRPIVSNCGAATEKIAKWLVNEFRGIGRVDGKSVKNSLEFVEKIKNVVVRRTEQMVSFDVISLFPSIPINDAIDCLERWLLLKGVGATKTTDLIELTRFCMRHNNLQFRGQFWKMTTGTAMGNALSPLLAEIFMATYELELMSDGRFPRIWWRYVDDIFAVVVRRQSKSTLQFLNMAHRPAVQFTMEEEQRGALPFLDVLVTRTDDGTLTFKPFRKETSTWRTITSESNHSRATKMSAYHSMAHRMVSLPLNQRDFDEEHELILNIGEANGFHRNTISRIIGKHQQKQRIRNATILTPIVDDILQEDEKIWGRLVYDHELAKALQPVLKKYNVKAAFRSMNKIKQRLHSPKDATTFDNKSGIYQICCQVGCDAKYIGQTKRRIKDRLREHLNHHRNGDEERSAVALHLIQEHHTLNAVEPIQLIRTVNDDRRLVLWENLEIRRSPAVLMNHDAIMMSQLYRILR